MGQQMMPAASLALGAQGVNNSLQGVVG